MIPLYVSSRYVNFRVCNKRTYRSKTNICPICAEFVKILRIDIDRSTDIVARALSVAKISKDTINDLSE